MDLRSDILRTEDETNPLSVVYITIIEFNYMCFVSQLMCVSVFILFLLLVLRIFLHIRTLSVQLFKTKVPEFCRYGFRCGSELMVIMW